MDFLTLVSAKQKEKNLSDLDISHLTGINEYTFYNLKKYRIYLSKVSYFALCGVLGIPMLSDAKIEEVLKENKEIVGLPESNLTVAAECVNPEYLEKLERELSKLKETLDTVETKNKLLKEQKDEIERLKIEIDKVNKEMVDKVREAYSNGVKESLDKISMMKSVSNQRLVDDILTEYKDKMEKVEQTLEIVNEEYYRAYSYLYELSQVLPDGKINLSSFSVPLKFRQRKIKEDKNKS